MFCDVFLHNALFLSKLPSGYISLFICRFLTYSSVPNFQNEKQIQMLCQKVGQVVHAFCPHGAPFLCVKFMEPAEEIIRRMKTEAPFCK